MGRLFTTTIRNDGRGVGDDIVDHARKLELLHNGVVRKQLLGNGDEEPHGKQFLHIVAGELRDTPLLHTVVCLGKKGMDLCK